MAMREKPQAPAVNCPDRLARTSARTVVINLWMHRRDGADAATNPTSPIEDFDTANARGVRCSRISGWVVYVRDDDALGASEVGRVSA